MAKWFLTILALLMAVTAAFVVLAVTDVIEPGAWVQAWAERSPQLRPYLQTYRRGQEAGAWIDEQEQRLAVAEQELSQREQELAAAWNTLSQQSVALDARESNITDQLNELEEQRNQLAALQGEEANTMLLADMYSDMRPGDAAAIFERMDEATALAILRVMNPRQSAPIMADMDRDLAARLSQRLKDASP